MLAFPSHFVAKFEQARHTTTDDALARACCRLHVGVHAACEVKAGRKRSSDRSCDAQPVHAARRDDEDPASCEPPAGADVRLEEDYPSRASLVNCSGWLGPYEQGTLLTQQVAWHSRLGSLRKFTVTARWNEKLNICG